MPFNVKVDDVVILDRDRMSYTPDGGTIEINTSIVRRLDAPLPDSLGWIVAFEWSTDERSTVTCTAEVRDGALAVVASGAETISAEPNSSGRTLVKLSAFRVTATGTYTVRLYVGGSCVFTESIDVVDFK